jgi:3-deoxy-7-phosphoheptulonate synthase
MSVNSTQTQGGPTTAWSPDSWTHCDAEKRVAWPDEDALQEVTKRLSRMPPLIYAGEARRLADELARVERGEAFVLQAGDCAETFDEFSADRVRDGLKVILQMAIVLTYSAGVPTVKIGRVAGQFAKPRSADTEVVCGETMNTYQGDMVNSRFADVDARTPNPENLIRSYDQATATLNLLRGFTKGGFADLADVHAWNRAFVASSSEGRRYEAIATGIDKALELMRACGVDSRSLHEVDLYASHEALVLAYEQALTRQDSTFGDRWYDCSAHMLWIGTRTKKLDHAHVEFLRGVGNPLGVKIDKDTEVDHVLGLCERLNPERTPGRLTLISRMGRTAIADRLPRLIAAVRDAGHPVVWMCDPMHGNTFTSEGGLKTRRFDDIFGEIAAYFDVHASLGTWPGGVHLELTGDNVTECLGGSDRISDEQLHDVYNTACDPRLNANQSLDLAFQIGELLDGFRSNL